MTPHTPGPFPITDAILDARAWKAKAEILQTQHDELVVALKLARECITYCRRAHKEAQSGQGIPVEVIIDAALAKVQSGGGGV